MLALKNKLKIFVIILIFASVLMQSFSFAKNDPYSRQEFNKPDSQEKVFYSENIIIDANKYHEFNPLNPVPVGVDKEEYDMVDNYDIDLKTLDIRIKYFAPAYLNIKEGASAQLWMSLYLKGGSSISEYLFKDTLNDAKAGIEALKVSRNDTKKELDAEKRENPTSARVTELENKIKDIDSQLNNAKKLFNQGNATINATTLSLKHKQTLYDIAAVDENNQVASARRIVTQTLRNLVLTYLKLNASVSVLKDQVELNKSMYEANKRSYNEGASTDVYDMTDYMNAKNTYNATNTIFKNVKEQVCINLGYDLSDIDKLNFIEPEPNIEYINNIKLDDDRDRAYNSNAAYNSIRISDKDKKLPGSTGEEIFNKERKYVAEKIVLELEDYYQKLMAAFFTYEGSMHLDEISKICDDTDELKKNQNLISDVQYNGLKVLNLSRKLQVKNAKYDLIVATDNYYYATMGNISIS